MRPDPWDRGAGGSVSRGGPGLNKRPTGAFVHSDPVSDRASCFVRDSAPSRVESSRVEDEMTGIHQSLLSLFEYWHSRCGLLNAVRELRVGTV